jgi:hypothetical protein
VKMATRAQDPTIRAQANSKRRSRLSGYRVFPTTKSTFLVLTLAL